MGLRNLRHHVEQNSRSDSSPNVEHTSTGATEDVEERETLLRYQLSRELYAHADFWLAVGGQGDCVHIIGQTRGQTTRARRAAAMELVREADGSIDLSLIEIDPLRHQRVGQGVSVKLCPEHNVPPEVLDVVLLGWLAHVTDPANGARQAGPAAYQDVEAGQVVDLVDD